MPQCSFCASSANRMLIRQRSSCAEHRETPEDSLQAVRKTSRSYVWFSCPRMVTYFIYCVLLCLSFNLFRINQMHEWKMKSQQNSTSWAVEKKKKTAVVNQQVERRVTIADGENTATAVREFSSCRRVDRNRRFSRTSFISGAGAPQTRSH